MDGAREVRELLDHVYAAMAAGDGTALSQAVSTDPSVLGIGTDPSEWWSGHAAFVSTWAKQLEEIGPIQLLRSDAVAYAADGFGWAADRPTFRLPDGTELEARVTLVAAREGAEWKLRHWHASIGLPNVAVLGEELTTSV